MYWLRWHYHVKDIAGAAYKIIKKSKKNDRIAEATGKARPPSAERLVDGTISMVPESAERRRRRMSTLDARCIAI